MICSIFSAQIIEKNNLSAVEPLTLLKEKLQLAKASFREKPRGQPFSIGQYRFFPLHRFVVFWQLWPESRDFSIQVQYAKYTLPAPSSSWKVATFQYKCSTQSTFWQLQLERSNFSVVCAVHFSTGSKVAAFRRKQV